MGSFKDLTDMDFDRWHVLELAEKRGVNYYYRCVCECGTEKLVKGSSLVHGRSKSCGCLQREIAKKVASKNFKRYNDYTKIGNVAFVILANTGNEMECDIDDWEKLKKYCWVEDAYGYAVAHLAGSKNKANIRFHDIVMNRPKGMVVDHINRNALCNRKDNLRIVTQRVNVLNRGLNKNNTSGYTGVSFRNDTGKWKACIVVHGKDISLGCFYNKKDAIQARRIAEDKFFKPILESK